MLTTSKRLLRAHKACGNRYDYLCERIDANDNDIIPLTLILEINGLDDVLWALCAVPKAERKKRNKVARLIACDFAESVLPIFEKKHPGDKRPREAIETARGFANGKATQKALDAAWSAARSAARSAAWSAAGYAAWSAARSAAWSAAWSAAGSAAWSVEVKKQEKIFKKWMEV